MSCSNCIQNDQRIDIDEQLKAKIFSRLVREYRRSLEHQKSQMIKDQKEREIEENMKQRFPALLNNSGWQQTLAKDLNQITDPLSQPVKYY